MGCLIQLACDLSHFNDSRGLNSKIKFKKSDKKRDKKLDKKTEFLNDN